MGFACPAIVFEVDIMGANIPIDANFATILIMVCFTKPLFKGLLAILSVGSRHRSVYPLPKSAVRDELIGLTLSINLRISVN